MSIIVYCGFIFHSTALLLDKDSLISFLMELSSIMIMVKFFWPNSAIGSMYI